ncbi:hypothetical protein JCM39194_15960 [Desulfotomaculum varum]
MLSRQELLAMPQETREKYLLAALQRKINELQDCARQTRQEAAEHRHGPDFHRGMLAGFVSGLGFATRLLAPEKAVCQEVMELLAAYNDWAQQFNRHAGCDVQETER